MDLDIWTKVEEKLVADVRGATGVYKPHPTWKDTVNYIKDGAY